MSKTDLDEMARRTSTVLIDKPGDYITRDGRRVTIHAITEGHYTFPCKGALWRMYRGELRPRGYDTWMRSGYHLAVGEHGADIVGPWTDTPDSL